jgi:hypothetical protein
MVRRAFRLPLPFAFIAGPDLGAPDFTHRVPQLDFAAYELVNQVGVSLFYHPGLLQIARRNVKNFGCLPGYLAKTFYPFIPLRFKCG